MTEANQSNEEKKYQLIWRDDIEDRLPEVNNIVIVEDPILNSLKEFDVVLGLDEDTDKLRVYVKKSNNSFLKHSLLYCPKSKKWFFEKIELYGAKPCDFLLLKKR